MHKVSIFFIKTNNNVNKKITTTVVSEKEIIRCE